MQDRNSPEPLPEATGSDWIKMSEAAQLLGMSERAARDWVSRYQIPKRSTRPVLLDAGAIIEQLHALGKSPGSPRNRPEGRSEAPGSTSEPIEAQYRMPDVRAEQQLAILRDTLLKPHLETIERQAATIAEQAETIGRVSAERDALANRVEALERPPAPERQRQFPATFRDLLTIIGDVYQAVLAGLFIVAGVTVLYARWGSDSVLTVLGLGAVTIVAAVLFVAITYVGLKPRFKGLGRRGRELVLVRAGIAGIIMTVAAVIVGYGFGDEIRSSDIPRTWGFIVTQVVGVGSTFGVHLWIRRGISQLRRDMIAAGDIAHPPTNEANPTQADPLR